MEAIKTDKLTKKYKDLTAVDSLDLLVEQGDVLTVRGLGKCCLAEVGGQSRKGRTGITMKRFV